MNCVHCTFVNLPTAKICEICFKSFNTLASNVIEEVEESNGIQCDLCAYFNSEDDVICKICGAQLYRNATDNSESFSIVGDQDEAFGTIGENLVVCPQKECEICFGDIGSNYFAMIECTHVFCKDCAIKHFTKQITERPILECICPMCNLPDLHSNAHKHVEYFSLLLACLKPILDENITNVFEKKLTDVALSSDPDFVWCVQCSSGFVVDSVRKMVRCNDCGVRFCVKCGKVWESQHAKISCEEFDQWQRDNNLEVSHEAIGKYLKKNGIDCPKCKFKYDLSKGGCIHFTCTQCKYQFCFGCSKPFVRSCKISTYCKTVGLHAHHQRNCFYYLRDKTVADLQRFLKTNKINFMVDTADDHLCPIELQIEKGLMMVDTICNQPTEPGNAGLCSKHYKEYLIVTITGAKLETTPILTVRNYHELLRFQGISIPSKSINQTDIEYKNVCEMLVKKNVPLQ